MAKAGRSHARGARQMWILTALGKDRPGIVADVTKMLFRLGCNLEDSAMTRLGGEFTIMLAFSAPGRVSPEQLERAFAPLSRRLTLAVHLKSLTRSEVAAKTSGTPYLISVYGSDHPGIVYRVSALLAKSGINIIDVSTHRAASQAKAKPLYLMLLEVELPIGVSVRRVELQLRSLAKKLGVEVSLRSQESAVL